MRTCKKCESEFPDSDFQMRQNRYFRSNCRKCESALRLTRSFSPPKSSTLIKKRKRQTEWHREQRYDLAFRSAVIFRDSRGSDRKTGRLNNITKEHIHALITQGCSYCGNSDLSVISLDRINNDKGHTFDNVVAACFRCNLVRGDMPYAAWEQIVPAMRKTFEMGLFENWSPKRRNRGIQSSLAGAGVGSPNGPENRSNQ